jgi:2-desacetyl-2-hydroxyethyl bacteriochlorophyllide A dehydrogenase
MRAVVVSAPGKVEVTTAPDPAPGPREVVLQIAGCGICGTDLHLIHGELPYDPFPVIPGHEFAGTVVAVGADVDEVAVGDRVAADPNVFCGECHYCRIGRGNLCDRYGALGVTRDGACAEFLAVPVANCFRLPEEIALRDANLIEPLSCVVHGFDLLPGAVGANYLVYGAGTMGLMVAQLASRAGAASVSVVDPNADRLAVSAKLGADVTVTSAEELDRPEGYEVVIDATGVPAAIEDGLTRVRRGGTFQVFGVASEDARMTVSPFRIYKDEITIIGSMAVLHSFGRAVDLLAKGVLNNEIMNSHEYSLEDYPTALEDFVRGIGRKLVVRP